MRLAGLSLSCLQTLVRSQLCATRGLAGGPGVSYKGKLNDIPGSPVVAIVGGAAASPALTGSTWQMLQNGTFGSGDFSGLLTGNTADDFFALLAGAPDWLISCASALRCEHKAVR